MVDGSSLLSGLGIGSTDTLVCKEDGKPPLVEVVVTHLDRKEEFADGSSADVSSLTGIKHSQVESKIVSTSAGENPSDAITPCLSMTEISNAVSQNESEAMITDEDNRESKKLEFCPVLCDSTVKEGDGSEPAVVKNSEEATTREIIDEPSIKVTGEQ